MCRLNRGADWWLVAEELSKTSTQSTNGSRFDAIALSEDNISIMTDAGGTKRRKLSSDKTIPLTKSDSQIDTAL